ncbi:sigma-70 family RNA polymerase sigma factor, partial [Streptomyces sp. SID5789]|nr:sigma-70 family RNA polymerase sigma factor [Streptomyces sp. SID5789]
MAHDLVTSLSPLLTAEAAAEAHASGAEPGDLEQAVWLRLLERLEADGPPADPHRWLRRAVRTE